jgi:hypothetical protein
LHFISSGFTAAEALVSGGGAPKMPSVMQDCEIISVLEVEWLKAIANE